MTLTIIIPVYNEEKTIRSLLKELEEVTFPRWKKEIIIVNDGSTDRSLKVIETCHAELVSASRGKNRGIPNTFTSLSARQVRDDLKIITHKKNMGKGAAVRSGIRAATGDYILIQDADLEYHPKDIGKLLEKVNPKQEKIVYGTRLKRLPDFNRDERTIRFFSHYVGNKMLSLITSVLYGQWITDMETGYKLLPREIVQDLVLHAKGFEFEPEVTAKLLKRGHSITEVPISTNPRGYSEGKKLNTVSDGIKALTTLIKYRFTE